MHLKSKHHPRLIATLIAGLSLVSLCLGGCMQTAPGDPKKNPYGAQPPGVTPGQAPTTGANAPGMGMPSGGPGGMSAMPGGMNRPR